MNLTDKYKKYFIDTNKYCFIRVTKSYKEAWSNNYIGEIFVAKKKIYMNAYCKLPNGDFLNSEKAQGDPVLVIADYQDIEKSAELIPGDYTSEKPVNWDDYISEVNIVNSSWLPF